MRNLNIKIFIYIFLTMSLILWLGIAALIKVDISRMWEFAKILPTVATIDIILFAVFTKWIWRWKTFHDWLVPFPNLSGTWQGIIQTTWISPETGTIPSPTPVVVTIKQSFGKLNCVMHTDEMTSYSYAEAFKLEKEQQIKQLVYSYTSKPKPSVAERSIPHEGTVVFRIIEKPTAKLEGYYWTDRKSTGEIRLKFRGIKLLEELPRDINYEGMNEVRS